MLDAFNRVTQQIAEHADLAELRNRGFHDFESLDDTDRARFSSYMHGIFRTAEDAYYQHLQRHLDTRVWRGVAVSMRELNAVPGVQAWWRSHSHWFGEKFVKQVNQLQRDRAKTAARLRQLAKNVPARRRCTEREQS